MKFTNGILALLIAANLLCGCAPVVIGGAAAGTAAVATSRRSAGTVVDDETIEMKARLAIMENKELRRCRPADGRGADRAAAHRGGGHRTQGAGAAEPRHESAGGVPDP
jgi:osmotically-inducible protein OsmY